MYIGNVDSRDYCYYAAMENTTTNTNAVSIVGIDSDYAGQRIDNFLINHLKGVPKSRIYRLLRKGEVRVNKGRIKPEYKLCAGDLIRIPPIRVAAEADVRSPGQKLSNLITSAVLYENDDLIVINKASGLAVHGGSGINLGVIEVLRHAYNSKKLELVHRIDRDTSGCLLIAKKRSMLRNLQDQFREKTVKKEYLALVEGDWAKHLKRVDAPLLKNQLLSGERIVRVATEGKPSLTEFQVVERFRTVTLIKASPISGRTHQIRVHTQFSGHPIVGDEKYGNAEANKSMKAMGVDRLFLHAASIEFDLPGDGARIKIEAPLPQELSIPLEKLRHLSDNLPR